MARLFASEGAAVCVADMDKERADAVAGEIAGSGGRAIAAGLDVCQAGQWAQAVGAAAGGEAAFCKVCLACGADSDVWAAVCGACGAAHNIARSLQRPYASPRQTKNLR